MNVNQGAMRQLAALVFSIILLSLAACRDGPDFSKDLRERLQAFVIPSGAAAPTLLRGDYILVNKVAYRDSPPARGDVVVFWVSMVDKEVRPRDKYPKAEKMAFIFRIVGLPGDRVRIQKGDLYINRQPQTLTPIDEPDDLEGQPSQIYRVNGPGQSYKIVRLIEPDSASFDEVTVEPDRYFMMGDNRDRSYDSRFWGTVHRNDIFAKAWVIYFSKEPDTFRFRFSRFLHRIHESDG
jgi:signal peptidase I